MISKKEYDAALNPDWVPWGKLTDAVKQTIKDAKRVEFLTTDGNWEHVSCPSYLAGKAYRIHPTTEYKEQGLVEAKNIQGFSLAYGGNRECLRFRRGSDTVDVEIHSLLNALRSIMGQDQIMVIAGWHDVNRPLS